MLPVPRLAAGLLAASAGMILAGCASPRAQPSTAMNARLLEETSLGTPREGEARPGDAIVRVWIGRGTCSGVLVSPSVVLTARHCVMERSHGREIGEQPMVAGALHVELGGDYLPWGRISVTSVHACEPTANEERDIAALVLARPVPWDVPILSMASLSAEVDEGGPPARYRVVGFGSEIWPKSAGGITLEAKRRHGSSGSVKSTSDDTITLFARTAHGDSGGAVIDLDSHALVAVISRGDYARQVMGVRYEDLTIGARVDRCAAVVSGALARAGAPRVTEAVASAPR